MKRKITVLLALLIALSVLLQGCAGTSGSPEKPTTAPSPFSWNDYADNLQTTDPSTAPSTDPTTGPLTPGGEFVRDVDPLIEPVDFSEMKYERPDTDALCKGFNDVQDMVENGSSATDVLAAYDPVYDDYLLFDTMESIAYIHYTLDLNDT